MFKKYLVSALIALIMAMPAFAYDKQLAKVYQDFFSAFEEKMVPKELHRIPVEKLAEMMKKEQVVLLDVRTLAEQQLVGLCYKHTLSMPMNDVFKPENLAKIPTDKKVVATCHKGLRCTIIALGLRNIGFDNVYSAKGGMLGLMKYVGAKTAF
jgi:rhodanese-related sulfurtransferase